MSIIVNGVISAKTVTSYDATPVFPSGFIAAVSKERAELQIVHLDLGSATANIPTAQMLGGQTYVRAQLSPVAVAVTKNSVILVFWAGNDRIQAFNEYGSLRRTVANQNRKLCFFESLQAWRDLGGIDQAEATRSYANPNVIISNTTVCLPETCQERIRSRLILPYAKRCQ